MYVCEVHIVDITITIKKKVFFNKYKLEVVLINFNAQEF